MKWMKAGHTGDFRLPIFDCRSSVQPEAIKDLVVSASEGEISSDALAYPAVQGSASSEIFPAQERVLENSAQDERLPIRIHKEGLLG